MGYIELKNVTYTYPLAEEPSVRDISAVMERGKFYSILGANGSGKTTLCNILRGFIPNFYQGEMSGEVIFDGKNLQEYEMGELASKIGYVFQNPFNQITGARDTVYGEIAYGLENFGVPVPEIRDRVDQIMELTNITYLRDKNPFELSGGQQQRVAFASVLVLEPDMFVIDEPTSQLDPRETERVFDIILKMKEMGKTIVLVEHKMELVAQYSDEVLVLEEGRLIRAGEKHEILSETGLQEHGVMLPQTVLLAEKMRNSGLKIKDGIITEDEMREQLVNIGR
uniref:energy-coupling factor ABC transporter ATP-binding protein n=1 Tax=Lachnoclostridium phocaeense TaxID=1871021 RepID=UPI0026DC0A53|nr:ABC transporter ATP-binding protein [Lachnoclostridium phocaeense]